jgi:ligand-binding sensor domain-containing protein
MDVVSEDLSQRVNIRSNLLDGASVGALAFDRADGEWQFAYVGMNNRGRQGLLRWTNSNDIFMPADANFTVRNLSEDVNEYRDIIVDSRAGRNHLWVASGEGLFQYDLLTQTIVRNIGVKLTAAPGLLSPDIRDLHLDEFGSLWIATTRGVNRIQLDALAGTGILGIDAYSTRETIAELNSANPAIGRLYDPLIAVKPLPSASTISLAYDRPRRELLIGTERGLAIVDVTNVGIQPTTPVDKAFAFPNPLRVLDGHEVMYIGGINEDQHATVRIYNLEGELVFDRKDVKPLEPGKAPTFANEAWDLKTLGSTADGFFAATSGVYLVRIETSQGTKVTNITVIR